MGKISYAKPPLNYSDQVQQLQNRGLEVKNVPRAIHLLESISYYRLSGYWYPMLAHKTNHNFKKGSTFQNAFLIYSFDRELRILVLRELEKIEISIRAKLIYVLSHHFGAFWYQDANLFYNHIKHGKCLGNLQNEYKRSIQTLFLPVG